MHSREISFECHANPEISTFDSSIRGRRMEISGFVFWAENVIPICRNKFYGPLENAAFSRALKNSRLNI